MEKWESREAKGAEGNGRRKNNGRKERLRVKEFRTSRKWEKEKGRETERNVLCT